MSNNRLERPGWKEQRRLKERDEKKEDIRFKEENTMDPFFRKLVPLDHFPNKYVWQPINCNVKSSCQS